MVLLGMQIAKCFGGYLQRVSTALASEGPLLQQKAFVGNLLWSQPLFEWCVILKNPGQILL